MISEKCIRGMLGRATGGLCSVDYEMSAVSVRGAHHATGLDARTLRLRGVLTGVDGVRRNLFGCTDSDENRRFLERELEHQLEIDSQRWGFDFAKEQPLPGRQRFTWDLVPASSVPAALRTPAPAPPAPRTPAHARSPEPPKIQKRITGVGVGFPMSGPRCARTQKIIFCRGEVCAQRSRAEQSLGR
ncbi:Cyclin-dependent kinase inhibitor 1 [Eumeta japonica]|uniref:Cyclin-dependent kinase inhibitor 1 n=1 Tax=Eumeta variegata TaxID=151549 RepID=A0A4C1Z5F7_EUMVA|nr:Cyclin-dependent kinase inhibitor 1 [Eumeta japonica]